MDLKRNEFFNDLDEKKREEYFSVKMHKFLPSIDNIYYSTFLSDDYGENPKLHGLFAELDEMKTAMASSHKPMAYGNNGLVLDFKTFNAYKYCLSNPDLYDIFIIGTLPNSETPRVHVQLRAFGLWTYGAEKMLLSSYNHVMSIFGGLGFEISDCRENRIDYCYHTNEIVNPEKIFHDKNVSKSLSTTLTRWHQTGRITKQDGNITLRKDYFALGERSSNNVFFRCYNKALEVIENKYKGFFFKLWQDNGLINFYDRYCFEYALTEGNYDNVHKAKLLFYLEYGTREDIKKKFEAVLNDVNTTMEDIIYHASYMPEVTTVMNVEYETKRKFYYYSDDFIDEVLICKESPDRPGALDRIYKIIDNKALFLEYLTRKTVSFVRQQGRTSRENVYVPWWARLRRVKLTGIKADTELLREYSSKLDERTVQRRIVNAVATNAVYNQKVYTDFKEDISDFISNLNDNDVKFFQQHLRAYQLKKEQKNIRLKNRISKD